MQRRLAAILAADIVGYSRMMGADELATLNALRQFRQMVFAPVVAEHGGLVVKSMGDGWLVEFSAAVNAVTCALQVQQKLADHETIKLRIGIHIGDVAHEDDDIFGDGVNVAARLEAFVSPGGIAISDAVRSSLDGTLAPSFEDAGAQELKNISQPIRVWTRGHVVEPSISRPTKDNGTGTGSGRRSRPSIAVMPFANLSSDADQAFLAEGLVEDVVAALGRFASLFVISRTSTSAYQGSTKDARAVAEALGASYIVEGSVRRAGERLRVTIQLIDGETGGQLRSERFDRTMADLFDLQDELTKAIISAVAPEVSAQEMARVRNSPKASLTAWELHQRAMSEFYTYDAGGMAAAKALSLEAIEADPNIAASYSLLARIYCAEFVGGGRVDEDLLKQGVSWAERAVANDRRSDLAQNAMGFALLVQEKPREAFEALQQGLALNPNNADLRAHLAYVMLDPKIARYEEALEHANEALKLSPLNPFEWSMHAAIVAANMLLGDLEEAAKFLNKYRSSTRSDWKGFLLGAVCELMRGNDAEAEALLKRAQKRALPTKLSLQMARNTLRSIFTLAQFEPTVKRLVELGLPES